MALVQIKDIIKTDEKLRGSDSPPLYDLSEPNAYEGCHWPKTYLTLNNKGFTNERRSVDLSGKGKSFQALYEATLGMLPENIRRHVAICGGSIFRIIHDDRSRANDIDMFLYGLNSKKHAITVVKAICQIWCKDKPSTKIYRTKNSVSLICTNNKEAVSVGKLKFDKIQIILRMYDTLPQILYGFDLQCAAFAMVSGSAEDESETVAFKVMGSELSMFSLATCHLIVDTGRRSESFAPRLEKYMRMGMILIFPFLDPIKAASEFANCGFPLELLHQRSARIQLKDAKVVLVNRIDEFGFEGHIFKTNRTKKYYDNGDYDHIGKPLWNTNKETYYNLTLIINWKDQETQPNLFLPIEDCSQIDNDINIKKYARNNKQALVDIVSKDFKINDIRYPSKYVLEFRDVNPDTQWTTSFDPIMESPQDWYGDFYSENELSETTMITYTFDPNVLGQQQYPESFNTENGTKSLLQSVLGAQVDTVADLLTSEENNFVIPLHLTLEMIPELIIMNSLRNNGSLSDTDIKAALEFLLTIVVEQNKKIDLDSIHMDQMLFNTFAVKRNTGLFRNPVKRTALLQNSMKFTKMFFQILQKKVNGVTRTKTARPRSARTERETNNEIDSLSKRFRGTSIEADEPSTSDTPVASSSRPQKRTRGSTTRMATRSNRSSVMNLDEDSDAQNTDMEIDSDN